MKAVIVPQCTASTERLHSVATAMSRFATRIEKLARALLQKRRPSTDVKRVLVAHQLLLGDTVLLAPLLKALALMFPDAERVTLCRPTYLPIFEQRPYGFTALPYLRRDPVSERRVMASGPYDLAIVVDDNRYAWLARAAGAHWIHGFGGDRPSWKNWMLDCAVPIPVTPLAWADMLPSLAGSDALAPFEAGEWPAPPFKPFDLPKRPYLVLHVGASSTLKQWPAARWQAVAQAVRERGIEVVWSGAATERAMLGPIGAPTSEAGLFGVLDLAQLWQLLANSSGLVSPDTGVAHLARLTGIPALVLYGPASTTVHGLGNFFANVPIRMVESENFPCRDQQVLYRREVSWVRRCGRAIGAAPGACPEALCMQAIDKERVLIGVEAMLHRTL